MICVYVGGAYSATSEAGVFANMRRGMLLSKQAFDAGFATFTPWHDYHHSLLGHTTVKQLKAASMAWLEKSDALLLVPEGIDESVGTQAEIVRATELGIPVFLTLEALCRHFPVEPGKIRKDVNDGAYEAV